VARLSGKVAIVSGAGMGQGKSTALRLAREETAVIAADMNRLRHRRPVSRHAGQLLTALQARAGPAR